MRNIKCIIVFVMAVFITGCTHVKDAPTIEAFEEKMKEHHYELIDRTNEVDYATKLYRINSEEFVFTFIKGKRKVDIEGLFIDECKNVVDEVGETDDRKQEIDSGTNWSYLKLSNSTYVYYVSWINDTYIYIKAPKNSGESIIKVAKELGY